MLRAVREQGLEGIVGKRKDSLYESGKRSGAWITDFFTNGTKTTTTFSN